MGGGGGSCSRKGGAVPHPHPQPDVGLSLRFCPRRGAAVEMLLFSWI